MAREYAVLATGFRIAADRHEARGSKIYLFNDAGRTEVDASAVVSFVTDEYVPPKPPAPVPAPERAAISPAVSPRELVDAAAAKYGLPASLVHSVVAAESGYQVHALSPKGAVGLMQLMPATAREYGADPKNPQQNVDAGTQYLRVLLQKYWPYDDQVARALAAYNAGPGAVDRYHGVPPYRETRNYVARVIRQHKSGKSTAR